MMVLLRLSTPVLLMPLPLLLELPEKVLFWTVAVP